MLMPGCYAAWQHQQHALRPWGWKFMRDHLQAGQHAALQQTAELARQAQRLLIHRKVSVPG